MTSDQIAQAKLDIDVALRLIELGHLEPAQEVLRFASAELNDALSIGNEARGSVDAPDDYRNETARILYPHGSGHEGIDRSRLWYG